MRMKKVNKINILVIGAMLGLAGCVSTQDSTKSEKVEQIATTNFNLPEQIQWKQVKNQEEAGNILAEWIPEGSELNNTPVRVIYQRIPQAKPASEFVNVVVEPLQKVCTDIKVSPFKTTSTYENQASVEAICARLGKNNFGTVSYLSVFADNTANHMLVSEIKMPPSDKAGVLKFKNAKEKQLAETSSALANLLYQSHNGLRVCNADKHCQ